MAPIEGAPWTGPSTGEMLRTHTLAHEVIARHDDPCPVFDGAELDFLQDYIADPSTANGQRLLAEHAVAGPDADPSEAAAGNHGSLVGFIIAREVQGEVLLNDTEKAALREWYANGKAKERIQAWKEERSE
jgi:hypothetical protein